MEQPTEVMVLLQRMQQQLTYLEKKIDTLIQQAQPRPFGRERISPGPYRPFNRPNRPDQGHRYGRGPSHGHGQAQSAHGHDAKKKPYFNRERNH